MKTLKLYRAITVLLFLSTLLVSMTCEDNITYEITFINKSDEPVSINWDLCPCYTQLIPYSPLLKKVEPKGMYTILVEVPDLAGYREFGSERLNILVYKQSTLDAHTEEERIEEGIFDKRFVLSYKELEKANFVVIYE